MTHASFNVEEATIQDIQAAFHTGHLTARRLVECYLERIHALDRTGPSLNSIITLNARALDEADACDRHFQQTGMFIGPLHGITIMVKDQVETKGIMTTFGSAAQNGYIPAQDATAITRLRAAGAIILAKTNLPDYATSWFGASSQQGETKNPYRLAHDPGGSSSGTAASVAASLGTVGLGEDTGGSIRLPASFNNLVGLRVTPGLISRAGMIPLICAQDTPGPMTRTVRDAARLLDCLAGFDPADDYTVTAAIGPAGTYESILDDPDGLHGARLGVLRQALGDPDDETGSQVHRAMQAALRTLRNAGAELIDIEIPNLEQALIDSSVYEIESKYNIDAFLASRPGMPAASLDDVRKSGRFEPNLDLLKMIFDGPDSPDAIADYGRRLNARSRFQRTVCAVLAGGRLDAMIYPAVRTLPPLRADIRAGRYDCLNFPTNTLIASQACMPSLCMPAGFSGNGLPIGMEIVGLPYHEATVLRLGAAFERLTMHRRAPAFVNDGS